MKTAIGFLGGQFGDVLLEEPTIRAFLAQNADYNLILACNKKYFDALRFYEGYSPRITGFYAYEGYDNAWPVPADRAYIKVHEVDLVFNAMAQHKDFYWPLYRHQTVECGQMFGITITDLQIRLPQPPGLRERKNTIALALFPNNAVGPKSLSLAKAQRIADYCRSKGYEVLQINGSHEPRIAGAAQTDTDFYTAGVAMLGCSALVCGDTAMSWLASAFELPVVGLYSLEYYPFCSTSANWNPVNKNATYLEAGRAEDIPDALIFQAFDTTISRL